METNIKAVKRLNRMEADIAAKERSLAGRGSGTQRVSAKGKPVAAAATASVATTAKRLDRMEADIAAKAMAKAGRASAVRSSGSANVNSNSNARAVALAKKLDKSRAARGTPKPRAAEGGIAAKALEDAKMMKNISAPEDMGKSKSMGMSSATIVGAMSSTAMASDDKKHDNSDSSKHYHRYRNGKGNGNAGSGQGNTVFPGGNDVHDPEDPGSDNFREESHKSDGSNENDNRNGNGNGKNLAVAVAVYEDRGENVFIPSAVEYDVDAINKQAPPMYKNQRFRVYGLLSCTLLVFMAACAIGVMTILKKHELDSDWLPTEAPTCARCTMDFLEQLELEVGLQKLGDLESPEYAAKEWIIHEDEMELLPTDKNYVQRFLMATFYFDTHRLADWRSCNRQNSQNETEKCTFLKVTSIKPELAFEGCK